MSEWILIALFLILTCAGSLALIYPLRKQRKRSLTLVPILFICIFSAYYFWGGFALWQKYLEQQEQAKVAQKMLASIKSPEELIDKLRAKLDNSPKSAKGWYLLGRLYTSQQKFHLAKEAFETAYDLKPDEEQYAVHYAQSIWQENNQQFNSKVRAIFKSLLKNNPNQADALAMLAMDAYMSQSYKEAIDYWQRLLILVPEQSEESLAIRRAIAKANKH